MKKRKKNRSSGAPTPFLLCMRGAILACILTAVLVLVFAFLLKWGVLQPDSIRAVNTAIKAICAGLAGYLSARAISGGRSWLYGALSGGLYMTLAYVVFSILEREFHIGLIFLSDLLLGMVCGGGIGVIYSLVENLRAEA